MIAHCNTPATPIGSHPDAEARAHWCHLCGAIRLGANWTLPVQQERSESTPVDALYAAEALDNAIGEALHFTMKGDRIGAENATTGVVDAVVALIDERVARVSQKLLEEA